MVFQQDIISELYLHVVHPLDHSAYCSTSYQHFVYHGIISGNANNKITENFVPYNVVNKVCLAIRMNIAALTTISFTAVLL